MTASVQSMPEQAVVVPQVVTTLRTLSNAPQPISVPLQTALLSLLTSTTAPFKHISILLAALAKLQPSSLPANLTEHLSHAILTALLRSRQQHTATDLQHATQVLTILSARSDIAARLFRHRRIPYHLSRLCQAFYSPPLREHLRRFSIICADQTPTLRARATHLIGRPVRILSLDGGGTRALLSLQILRRMEMLTGRPIAASFDLIAGTSSGGVLAIALGLLRLPISKIEDLYLSLARRVFTPARAVGATVFHAGRLLLLNRGMYDAKALQDIFDSYCGTGRLYEHAAGGGTPRVMVLSTQMKGEGVRGPRVFLHTNYRHVGERYAHGCLHKVADALRATTAAPVYFDVFHDGDGGSFCDGAVLMNNPAAVAVHEARALWPGRELGVVVSVGTGLVAEGLEVEGKVMEGNGDGKVGGDKKERSMVLKVARAVLDSATDTEAVHHTLQDLLHQPDVYFRLNAELQHEVRLDEYRAAVLERMREIGAAYCSDNASGGRIIRRLCAKLAVGGRGGLWGKLGEAYARL